MSWHMSAKFCWNCVYKASLIDFFTNWLLSPGFFGAHFDDQCWVKIISNFQGENSQFKEQKKMITIFLHLSNCTVP